MISLTVTDLETLRRYREREEMTFAELLRVLRRERPQTEAMKAGEVLHSILEEPPGDLLDSITRDGHLFRFAIDDEIALRPFRELFGKKVYRIGGIDVELRGKADSFDGLAVADYKLTKSFDAQRYHDSYQWRAYLSIFNADRCTYDVFVGKQVGITQEGGPEWEISDSHQLTLYRYPELDADLIRELEFYVEFARRHLEAAAS